VRIQFQTEGGIAHFPGLSRPLIVDTTSLPPVECAQLEALVRAAVFFNLPAQVGFPSPKAADYRTYTITVEDAGRLHMIRVTEPVADPSLEALIDALRTRQRNP
jgi:hypothetical protein